MYDKMDIYDATAVNAYLLNNQRLLDEKSPDALAVIRDLALLDSNSLPNTYYSLYLRTQGFIVGEFQQQLYAGGEIARVRGLKGSLQVVPRSLLPAVYTVSKAGREAKVNAMLKAWGIGEDEYRRVAGAIREALGNKEKTLPQLKNNLDPGLSRDLRIRRGKKTEKSTNVAVVAAAMWDRWELLRGGIGRTPEEDPGRYSAFSRRFGTLRLDIDYRAAVVLLADRYVRAYGPVCAEDLAWWLGCTLNEAFAALSRGPLDEVEIKGIAGKYFVPQGEAIRNRSDEYAGVILLPRDDPFVKAYARRERFVPGPYPGRIVNRFGESESVVLIDGMTAGIWHLEKEQVGDAIRVEIFAPGGQERRSEIEVAAAVAGRFFTGGNVPVSVGAFKK